MYTLNSKKCVIISMMGILERTDHAVVAFYFNVRFRTLICAQSFVWSSSLSKSLDVEDIGLNVGRSEDSDRVGKGLHPTFKNNSFNLSLESFSIRNDLYRALS